MSAAIEIVDLRKEYGDQIAVAGVSLSIERGEIYAILGPNGAGKTTIVEILEGFRNRDGGTVSVLGFDPGVTFSQYFVAGMVASGLVNSGFQQLAISIPIERDLGGLKRLRGTPMSPISFFIGKGILVLVSMIIQVFFVLTAWLIIGTFLAVRSFKWSEQ